MTTIILLDTEGRRRRVRLLPDDDEETWQRHVRATFENIRWENHAACLSRMVSANADVSKCVVVETDST